MHVQDTDLSQLFYLRCVFFQANILFLGSLGVGKSSFYNTLNAGFQGYTSMKAISGSGPRSVTTEVGLQSNISTPIGMGQNTLYKILLHFCSAD